MKTYQAWRRVLDVLDWFAVCVVGALVGIGTGFAASQIFRLNYGWGMLIGGFAAGAWMIDQICRWFPNVPDWQRECHERRAKEEAARVAAKRREDVGKCSRSAIR